MPELKAIQLDFMVCRFGHQDKRHSFVFEFVDEGLF
jgi:hypothetical protein